MKRTGKQKFYAALIVVIAAAILVIVVSWLIRGGSQQVAEQVPVPKPSTGSFVPAAPKLIEIEKEISVNTVEDGIRDMGILITDEYYFTEVVSFSSVKKFFKTDIKLPFTESNYLAGYDGVVTAGPDFAAARVEKDEATKTVTVILPKSQIRNVDIDPDSFKLFSEKQGFSNPLSAEDFNSSLVELENTARQKALGKGILERADENAVNIVTNFIGNLIDLSVYRVKVVTE
ncbi:MAG: DUF4230 domain-containing protein [Clostridia bacterium]|nr:DUF4230 domain-containing protein [Clostridia bacterium]MBR0445547.1 DUF4230 domain-containing protein [Clostridia bacterium]